MPELESWLATNVNDRSVGEMLRQLVDLAGDVTVIDKARDVFAEAPAELEVALDELAEVVTQLGRTAPDAEIYLDLCELRGYHYHTGIVFAAFAPGHGQAIGNGGRYDHVGEAFGRSRPATGFNVNLNDLAALTCTEGNDSVNTVEGGIYAPAGYDEGLQQTILELRARGERVVCGFAGQQPDFVELHCNRQLVFDNGDYRVVTVSE